MMTKILIALLFSTPLWADGPQFVRPSDGAVYPEMQLNYYEHKFPHFVTAIGSSITVKTATASTATITTGIISSGTITILNSSTATITQLNASTGTINSFMVIGATGAVTALSGRIGEPLYSYAAATNYPTSGQYGDLTSLPLTPGDWDCSMVISPAKNGATITDLIMGISATSGNSPTGLLEGDSELEEVTFPSAAGDVGFAIPAVRFSVSAATTIYLKYLANYSVATPRASGRLSCRRAR